MEVTYINFVEKILEKTEKKDKEDDTNLSFDADEIAKAETARIDTGVLVNEPE